MAQQGHLFPIRSISTVHFTSSAAQNTGLAEGIPMPGAFGSSGKCRIKSIALWSAQALDWEIWLFYNAYLGFEGGAFNNLLINPAYDLSGASAIPPAEGKAGTGISFAARFKLAVANGIQMAPLTGAAAGPFFYYNDGNDLPYYDEVAPTGVSAVGGFIPPPKLHVVLFNRNATTKNAGATGAVVLQVNAEPTVGW